MNLKVPKIAQMLLLSGAILCGLSLLHSLRDTPWQKVSVMDVPLDGTAVEPAHLNSHEYRVIVTGAINCSYDGRVYDAIHAFTGQGKVDEVRLIDLAPGLEMIGADPARHRYTYRTVGSAQSLRTRINVEKLVDMFLIPPSEVIASLQGGIHIEVLEKRHGYPAVGLILLLAGMCSCSRRRLDEDLRDALGRINTEYLLAMGSLPKEAKAFPLLRTRLKRVRKDARRTAARVQSLRDAIRRIDRAALESQIEALQCDEDGNSIMGRERSKALREKCKVREMLDRLEQDERRSVVQLQRIADTLTTAHLRFRGIWISDPTAGSDELVLEQMGFELDALERTTSEIREFEHQIHISRTV